LNTKDKKYDVDMILRKALTSSETPDPKLIQNLKSELIKEEPILKKTTIRRSFSMAAAIAASMVLITATAFAAWQLMKPADIASELGDTVLSAAFDGESAIHINESQTAGGYKFTLMSIVSGNDISDYSRFYGDQPVRDRTYAVLATQKEDGSPMNFDELIAGEYSFRIGPLVRGLKPWQVFISRGGSATIIDGVMYVLIESDDISVFADRGVYIHVSTGFPGSDVITFHEETGELTPNPSYDGINILFDLPLDKSLADPVKAQEYLERLQLDDGLDDSSVESVDGTESRTERGVTEWRQND